MSNSRAIGITALNRFLTLINSLSSHVLQKLQQLCISPHNCNCISFALFCVLLCYGLNITISLIIINIIIIQILYFFKIHLVQYLIITCPPSPSYQTYHNCLYWTLRFHHIYIVIHLYAVNSCVNLYYF